jgi:hypothetical protein
MAAARGPNLLFVLPVLLLAGALMLPTAVLMTVGMVPTIVAFMVDTDSEKSAGLSVGAMNFCGVMPFAIKLWQTAHTLDTTIGLLLRPETWLFMYGAAAGGWLIYYGVPPLVAGAAVFRDARKIKELEQEREELIGEWGIEVTGKGLTPDAAEAKPAQGTKGAKEPPADLLQVSPILAKVAAANALLDE